MDFNALQLGPELAKELRSAFKAGGEEIADKLRQRLQSASSFGGQVWDRELKSAAAVIVRDLEPLQKAGQLLGVAAGDKAKAEKDHAGFVKQLLASGTAAAVTQTGAYAVGQTFGGPAGSAAGAAGSLATGAVGMATAPVAAGMAAAGLIAVAGAAKQAADAAKGFASAASPNGSAPLDHAAGVFSATIGSVLTPAMVMLSAGVMTAADKIWNELVPNLGKVAGWYQDHEKDFVSFADTIVDATHAVAGFGKFLKEYSDTPLSPAWGVSLSEGVSSSPFNPAWGTKLGGSDQDAKAGQKSGVEFAGPPAAPTTKDLFLDNMDALIKEMGSAMGPKGQVGGVQDAWKKAQNASFVDPTQQKMLDRFKEVIELLKQIAMHSRDTAGKPSPTKK